MKLQMKPNENNNKQQDILNPFNKYNKKKLKKNRALSDF